MHAQDKEKKECHVANVLTRVVPPSKAFGLVQGLHVPVHIALGALLLLGRNGNLLVFNICSPGDILWGTTRSTRFLQQFAGAILAGTPWTSNARNTKVIVLKVSTLPIITRAWNFQDLQFSNVTCPKRKEEAQTRCDFAIVLTSTSGIGKLWSSRYQDTPVPIIPDLRPC